MDKLNYDIPILLIVFNRPDYLKEVISSIKKIKPQKIYVASDGPRDGNNDDKINIKKCHEILSKEIDWECNFNKHYRTKNVGAEINITQAIEWMFSKEEYGIILEDDTVPGEQFYEFLKINLLKYKDDTRIMTISGNNFLPQHSTKDPYLFSEITKTWGWGTWRRAWQLMDFSMTNWSDFQKSNLRNKYKFSRYYMLSNYFDSNKAQKIQNWDYSWVFSCTINNGLTIIPKENLVTNIGLYGLHFKGYGENINKSIGIIDLIETKNSKLLVTPNWTYDEKYFNHFYLKSFYKLYLANIFKRARIYKPLKLIKNKIINNKSK